LFNAQYQLESIAQVRRRENMVTIELFGDRFYSTLSGCLSLHPSILSPRRPTAGQL
jgi:hypothetical protein